MSLLITLFACSDYNLIERDPAFNNAVAIEETEVDITETETTNETEATPETETEDSNLDDGCLPNSVFLIQDSEGSVYTVPSYLDFSLNASSRIGAIDEGMQDVITIDSRARCGDVILEKVLLMTTTDGDDIVWLSHVPEVMSGISYEWENTHVFHGYGEAHAEDPRSSVTAVYWDHEFDAPIVIPRNKTFSFTLEVEFGGDVTPLDNFHFRLYPRYTWHGTDDPSSYPDPIVSEDVDGNELTYE